VKSFEYSPNPSFSKSSLGINLNAAEFMPKTQEIKDPARMEKLTKALGKSKISMGDGKTLIDLEKKLACHKIPHKQASGERSRINSSTPLLFCQLKVGK